MCSLSFARYARAEWALYKIGMLAGHDESAQDHLYDARVLAHASGMHAFSEGTTISPILADVAVLAFEWGQGLTDADGWHAKAAERAERQRYEAQTVWVGE